MSEVVISTLCCTLWQSGLSLAAVAPMATKVAVDDPWRPLTVGTNYVVICSGLVVAEDYLWSQMIHNIVSVDKFNDCGFLIIYISLTFFDAMSSPKHLLWSQVIHNVVSVGNFNNPGSLIIGINLTSLMLRVLPS